MRFKYRALTPAGKLQRGTLVADSREDALNQLKEARLSPTSLRAISHLFYRSGRKPPPRMLLDFLDEFVPLLQSKLPIADSLEIIGKRETVVAKTARDLLSDLRRGETFTNAFASSAMSPRSEIVAIVDAGEKTGRLTEQLDLLNRRLTQRARFEREVQSEIVYPAILAALLIATIFFLAHLILPEFEDVFGSELSRLPPETRFVIGFGKMVREFGWLLPPILLGTLLITKSLSSVFQKEINATVLKVPFFGNLTREIEVARFCRTLGSLLEGGTPIAAAMPLASASVSNCALRAGFTTSTSAISLGRNPSDTFAQLLPEKMQALILIGEETSRLGEMTSRVADLCEQNVQNRVRQLTAFLGPSLTALMGGITAIVIGGVMTGILSFNDLVQ